MLFIAMRYVQGGDVRTLLDVNGTLPTATAPTTVWAEEMPNAGSAMM